MNNYTLKTIIALILLIGSLNSFSQQRTCGMEQYMQEMLQDPVYAKEYQENQRRFNKKLQEFLLQQDLGQRNEVIEIPVAVHFPQANESDRSCLEVLAQNQIDILNADFTATNSDISTWNNSVNAFFPSTNAGVANVSFCLATSNHPPGLDPELLEGNPAVTIGYNFGNGNNRDSNWAGYLNFVVRDLGVLGFSPLGGNISLGDAVTMDNNAFGSSAVPGCPGSGVVPSAPYNLGRTTTHELGHFFNLRHTFNGDGNGVCGSGGDFIADTPEVANSTYGCPSPLAVPSCVPGQPALTMNYMDYVNDACMYMFSAGQINVSEAWIVTNLQPFVRPNACQPAEPGFIMASQENTIFNCPDTSNQVNINFTYTPIGGFNENVIFTASNLPTGATVNFNPASLNQAGSVAVTIGNLSAVTEGNYTITITGTSTTVTESFNIDLNNVCTEVICNPTASEENLAIPIPDPSGGFAGVVTNIITVNQSAVIESVTLTVDINHTWISDLEIYIIPPGATAFPDDAIRLWDNQCTVSAGVGYENLSVTFDDSGANFPGTDSCSDNFTGVYRPNQPLNVLAGTNAQGDWELAIFDFFNGDVGFLNNWSIEICSRQPLNVSEFQLNNLSIYPNPSNGTFNLSFMPQNEKVTIDIYDIRGRAILSKSYKPIGQFNETLSLDNAKSGMYLLTITDGSQKITKKIIVE
jgi:subtilisin-like proprotein convertase family protein